MEAARKLAALNLIADSVLFNAEGTEFAEKKN
jgi:hypothetical protein